MDKRKEEGTKRNVNKSNNKRRSSHRPSKDVTLSSPLYVVVVRATTFSLFPESWVRME